MEHGTANGTDCNEEEMEEESVAYRDYDALESYRESKINYPISERDDEEADISNEEYTSPYQKEVISEDMFGKPAVSIEGNFVYEGMYGRPKYYIDGDLIRENNQWGKVVGRKRKF